MLPIYVTISLNPSIQAWNWQGRVYRLAEDGAGGLIVTNDEGVPASVRIGERRNSWGPTFIVEPTKAYAATASILTTLSRHDLVRFSFPDE